MFTEPHEYIEDVLKFNKVTKEKRKFLIDKQIRIIKRLKDIIAGKIKPRDDECFDPDFKVRLHYEQQVLDIMQIMSYQLGD